MFRLYLDNIFIRDRILPLPQAKQKKKNKKKTWISINCTFLAKLHKYEQHISKVHLSIPLLFIVDCAVQYSIPTINLCQSYVYT